MLFTTALLAVLLAFPAKVNAQCPVPTGMSTSNIDLFSAVLDWNTTIFADNSLLEIRPVGTPIWIPVIVQQTPFTVPGLLCGTDYEWRVSAICQLGPIILPSNPSAIQTFTTLGCNNLCPSPTALTSTNVMETSAELSWTPAFPFLTDYNLRYRIVGTSAWTDVLNVSTPYMVSGLACNTDYEWQAQTLCPNPFGNPIPGAWSATEAFSTNSCLPCVTPAGLISSNISLYGAVLSWTSSPLPATSYQMRYRVAGTPSWTVINNASSPYQLGSLTCNTAYQWQVRTVCSTSLGSASNFSSWSSTQAFSTLTCATGCPAPVGLTVSGISMQSVVLSWTATAPPPVTFQLRYRESGTTSWTLLSNLTSPHTLGNLNCKLSYDWQVRTACVGLGTPYSSWSPIATFATLDCDAFCPGPFGFTTTNVTLNSALFSWSIQAPLAVTFQVRYRVFGTTAWTFINNVPGLSYQALNLICDTDYEWQVRTNCNGIGNLTYSPWSVKQFFATIDCAAPCPDASALSTTGISLYSASLNWSLLTPAPVGFDVRYRLTGAANWIQVNNVTSPYQVNGLTCSSDYEWEVRTVCGNSVSNDPFSSWSATQNFSTSTCTFSCPAPSGLMATNVTETGAELSWLQTAPGSVTYQFRYRETGTTPWVPLLNNTPLNQVQVNNLNCNTGYQWQVRTVCGVPGSITYSAWSGLRTFTTLSCPSAIIPGATGSDAEVRNSFTPGQLNLTLYPNPASNVVTVSFVTAESGWATVEVRDVVGKLVYSNIENITSGVNQSVLDITSLNQGWYMVNVSTAKEITSGKLLISK